MNRQIRRVAAAVGVLMLALLVNLNYVQVVKGDSYRNNKDNRRVLLAEYANPRGQIEVQGTPIAQSVATSDELKYLRKYPNGGLYAPLTGFYSSIYGTDGLEDVEDSVLSGSDNRLFGSRLADLLTGRDPKGGSITLTLDKAAQQAAYTGLGGRRGAVVAIDPTTGAILAAVSSPSYDPNLLSSHNADSVNAAYRKLNNDVSTPMLNRAFQQSYPPGSIFKVVVAAEALKKGVKPTDRITAPTVYPLPDGGTMRNFGGESCGNGKTDTFDNALTISCNTAFAALCNQKMSQQDIENEAALFGMDGERRQVPLAVAASMMGKIDDGSALGQSCIGQRNVQMTPLQAAMIAAAVANNGLVMKPYVVQQERAPNLSVLKNTKSEALGDPVMTSDQAAQLQAMMENVVTKGTGTKAQIPNVKVGGKTGTADNGPVDAKGNYIKQPHAWFTGFALGDHPIAVAVVLENAGVTGSESAGGEAAAPIAKSVMQACLADAK